MLKECDTCLGLFGSDKFNSDCPNPNTCFKCRVSGVRLGIPGLAQDKDQWRHSTIAEQQRKTVAEGRANGIDPVPAWTSTSHAPTTRQLDKLKKHHA